MWLVLLSLVSTAAPTFELTVTPEQGPAELLRRARIRCGGVAEPASVDGGLSGSFTCPGSPRVDVMDELGNVELVVLGKISQVITPSAKTYGDPAPGWKRAAVKVERVLKGSPFPYPSTTKSASFLFAGSTSGEYAAAPKVKVGQRGVWLLRQGNLGPELMLRSALDAQPPEAADYLSELLTANPCPAAPAGRCAAEGITCPGPETRCTCERPCQGGANMPIESRPLAWVCRPSACSMAVAGETCAPDGMACVGCWGTHPFTCDAGHWAFHPVPSPPP